MSYALTPIQHRALNLVFNQMMQELSKGSKSLPDQYSFKLSEVSTSSTGGKNYRELRKTLKETTGILFEELSQDGDVWSAFVAIQTTRVSAKSSTVTFRVGSDLLEKFIEHHGNGFITTSPEVFLEMKSTYSMRLYELFKMYNEIGTQKAVKEVEWLRKWFSLKEGTYPRFNTFRESILEVAQKELASLENPVTFKMETIKSGRSVVAVEFSEIRFSKKKNIVIQEKNSLEKIGVNAHKFTQILELYERIELDTPHFQKFVYKAIQENKNKVVAPQRWLMASLPDIIVKYDEVLQKKQDKEVKKSRNKKERELKELKEEQRKKEIEELKEEIRSLPKAVVKLIESQYVINGGSIYTTDLLFAYPMLKDRINYDEENDIATLQETLV